MKKILSISLGLLLAGVSIAQSDDQVKDNTGKEEKPEKVKVEKVKTEVSMTKSKTKMVLI